MVLRLDPALAERLEAVAEVEGRSVSDVVREAIAALVAARQQDERFIRLVEDNLTRHQRILEMLRMTGHDPARCGGPGRRRRPGAGRGHHGGARPGMSRAAETALAEAAPDGASDPAASAAALLSALIRHRPLGGGNEVVAVAAMTTFLALNGWQADLDPAGAFPALLTGLASGQLPADDLIAWLSNHVFPSSGYRRARTDQGGTNARMANGPQAGRPEQGPFRRFTPEAGRR